MRHAAKELDLNKDCKILRVFLEFAIFCVSFYVIYKMTHGNSGQYISEYPSHINSAIAGKGYSIMEVIMKLLYRITGNTILISAFMGFIISCTIEAVLHLSALLCNNITSLLVYLSCSSIFVASIYIPVVNPYWYIWITDKGVISSFITQPWHNSTYTAMRLFAILSFVIFVRCWKNVNVKGKNRDVVLLFVMMAITNLFKPNFIIAFVPAVLLVFIVELLKNHGKYWTGYLKIVIAMLLSMFPLLVQYRIVYSDEQDGGWIFSAKRFLVCINEYGGLFIFIANFLLPVLVTIMVIVKERNVCIRKMFALAWIQEIIALIQCLFMTETGKRAGHGNFSWGIYCVSMILFVICITELVRMINEKKHNPTIKLLIGLLMINIVSGLMYFGQIFIGMPFMC